MSLGLVTARLAVGGIGWRRATMSGRERRLTDFRQADARTKPTALT
jgi:hypothetical protein